MQIYFNKKYIFILISDDLFLARKQLTGKRRRNKASLAAGIAPPKRKYTRRINTTPTPPAMATPQLPMSPITGATELTGLLTGQITPQSYTYPSHIHQHLPQPVTSTPPTLTATPSPIHQQLALPQVVPLNLTSPSKSAPQPPSTPTHISAQGSPQVVMPKSATAHLHEMTMTSLAHRLASPRAGQKTVLTQKDLMAAEQEAAMSYSQMPTQISSPAASSSLPPGLQSALANSAGLLGFHKQPAAPKLTLTSMPLRGVGQTASQIQHLLSSVAKTSPQVSPGDSTVKDTLGLTAAPTTSPLSLMCVSPSSIGVTTPNTPLSPIAKSATTMTALLARQPQVRQTLNFSLLKVSLHPSPPPKKSITPHTSIIDIS